MDVRGSAMRVKGELCSELHGRAAAMTGVLGDGQPILRH